MHHLVAATALPLSPVATGYREAPAFEETSAEAHLPELAPRVGVTVYELRGRFAGPCPWVLGRFGDPWEADALCQLLRRKGFGAVALDLRELPGALSTARGPLALRDEGLAMRDGLLPWARLERVVEALLDAERASDEVEQIVLRNSGRRMPTVIEVNSVRYARDRSRVLYLFDRDGDARRVPQDLARAAGVPGLTSAARFGALRDEVLKRAPHAGYDPRLVQAPRKRTAFSLLAVEGQQSDRRTDNASETDIAAVILDRAARERQRV